MAFTRVRTQVNRIVIAVAVCVILPLIACVERIRPGAGQPVARRCIGVVARSCGIAFEVRSFAPGPVSRPAIYVANHSSPVDIPAMLTARPDIRFMAASDLFRIPLLSSAMRALHTIPIDRHDSAEAHRQLDALMANPDRDHDVAIFAEGGIAPRGERLPFKTGAFALAIRTATPIVPVAIHGSAEVLPPRGFLAARPGRIVVELLEPIDPAGLTLDDRGALRDEVERTILSALDSSH